MSKAIKMLSLRSVAVRGLSGHTKFVPANTPTLVPGSLVQDALKLGCVPADEAELTSITEQRAQAEAEKNAHLEKLVAAVAELVSKDTDGASFTGGGLPQVKALEAILGHDISSQERDEAWALYNERNKQAALDNEGGE